MFNEKMLCALGRGLEDSGKLDEDGMKLTIAALRRFVGLARLMEVREIVAVATAAVRDASNGAAFVAEAERECNLPIQVISGNEEALLSAQGVLSGIPEADGVMGDLGGGSLELVALNKGATGDSVTLPLGPLRLAGIRDNDLLRDHVDNHLDKVKWLGKAKGRSLYLVGGAWRGIARIHMAHTNYPLRIIHHYRISASEADDITRLLSRQSKDSLARIAGVSRRRLDGIPAAALVLRRLVRAADPKSVIFSAHGLREGLCHAALSDHGKREDPLLTACRDIAQQVGRFGNQGEALFAITSPLFEGETPARRRLRLAACYLSDTAWRMHPDHRGEHVLSRVLNEPFTGIDHPERAALALALYVRYTGEVASDDTVVVRQLAGDAGREWAAVLGLALRLAQTFSGGTKAPLEALRLRTGGASLVLEVGEAALPLMGDVVNRRLEALAKALGRQYEVKTRRR